MKYIIAKNSAGILLPIIFDAHIRHKDVAKSIAFADCKFIGAGIFSIDTGKVMCCGESRSMELKPGERDVQTLELFLYGVG